MALEYFFKKNVYNSIMLDLRLLHHIENSPVYLNIRLFLACL